MRYLKLLFTMASFLSMLLLFAVPSVAQSSEVWFSNGFGHFFISIIAGILLAFAFQFLLTNLAVATGITAVGNVQDKFNRSRTSSGYFDEEDEEDEEDSTPTGVKISSGFGLYLVLTMSISLFFASLIAVKLTLTPDNTVGFTVGLVIWAGYLLLALYVDSKMISSLTGSILSSIKDTLSAGSSVIGSVFGSSETSRMKDTAQETVKAIHDEIRQEYDISGIQSKLDEYITKLEPQRMDVDNLKEDLAQLINEIEIKEEYASEDPQTIKRMFLEVASKRSGISEKDKEKLKNVFEQAKEIKQSEGSKTDKAMSAVDRLTPGDAEEGKKYREKVEQYLRETGREELDPDKLKEDLDRILNNPQTTPEVLEERVSKFDRSTLKSLISNIEGMDEQKTEKYVSKAEEALEMIKSKARKVKSSGSDSVGQLDENKSKTKQAIKEWFDRMDQPELKYDQLKHDVKRILDDPKATPSILKKRLQRMDRESLIALVSNNQKVDREQAERVVDRIEQGRDEVLKKADEIERELKEKTEKAKQETMRQIENARKTAAALAWWIFLAAVVSGGASALGGILALNI